MPLILGSCLQELSPHIERVIVHTDGVSSNYLVLRKVDYIDRVSDLYLSKGNIFDGVFTKLAVWKLEDYAKVLVLDLDIIPLKQQWCGVEGKKIIQAHCRMTDIWRAEISHAQALTFDRLWCDVSLPKCNPHLLWPHLCTFVWTRTRSVNTRCSWCCTSDHTVSATEFVQYKAPVDPAKRHDGLPPDDASLSDQTKCTWCEVLCQCPLETEPSSVGWSSVFGTEDYQDYPMGGSRGIFNAGLLLLQPDYCLSTNA